VRIRNILLQYHNVGVSTLSTARASDRRQQTILKIRGIDHHDVKVAARADVESRHPTNANAPELRFREQASFIALLAYHHRHSQAPCNEQGSSRIQVLSREDRRPALQRWFVRTPREYIELHPRAFKSSPKAITNGVLPIHPPLNYDAHHRSLQARRAQRSRSCRAFLARTMFVNGSQ